MFNTTKQEHKECFFRPLEMNGEPDSDSSKLDNSGGKEVIIDQIAPEFDISSLTKEVEAMEMDNVQEAATDEITKKVKIVFPKAKIWVSWW